MLGAAVLFIAIASCNALHQRKAADRPTMADNRIYGGSETTIEKYPFAVQIYYKTTEFRGAGSLLSSTHVLTRAGLFQIRGYKPEDYAIRAGTTYFNKSGSVHSVTAIKVHELYKYPNNDNDLAVILMATPVDLKTSLAGLAELPDPDYVVPVNSSVTVIGWGHSERSYEKPSPVLKELTIQKKDLEICQAHYKPKNVTITNNMICTGILDGGAKGMCTGDYGGPLIYKKKVVGIATYTSFGCGNRENLEVYTRVANYISWITKSMQASKHPANSNKTEDAPQNETDHTNCSSTCCWSTGSPSSIVGAVTLLTPLLHLIITV